MAWRFQDSFDNYATANLTQVWTVEYGTGTAHTINAGSGRRGTQSLRCVAGNFGRALGVALPASGPVGICGFAFRCSNLAGVQTGAVTGWDVNGAATIPFALAYFRYQGTSQQWFRLNANGSIDAYRATTLLGSTAPGVISSGVTHYLECQVTIHASAGTIDIWVDNTNVLSLTGVNTQNGSAAAWDEFVPMRQSTNVGGTHTCDIDDLYVLDGSGSYNNSRLGDQRVDILPVNAAGNSNMSTPSTGSDRSLTVDETLVNSDTDYNTFAAVNDKDTYGLADHPVPGSSINAACLKGFARKSDSGTALVTGVLRISGTDYDHATPISPPSSYKQLVYPFERSPVDGTTAFTTAVIDAMEIGVKKTA